MLIVHYAHRLPIDYAMAKLRERAVARGPLWHATPGLVFKAFVISERGHRDARANSYGSFYLWKDSTHAAEFVADDRFAGVVETFGRPQVETLLPLAIRARAEATDARVLTRRDIALGPNEDLRDRRREELAEAEATLSRPGVAAVLAVLDAMSWRLVRLVLARDAIEAPDAAAFEIAHLARPGWAELHKEGPEPCR